MAPATDKAAKEAAGYPEEFVPISFEVAKAVLKQSIQDPEPTHPRVAEAYKQLSAAEKKITRRKDGAMLAQLRAVHCMGLAHYRNRVDPAQSATCGKCGD